VMGRAFGNVMPTGEKEVPPSPAGPAGSRLRLGRDEKRRLSRG
jgi:hypothetical protein